MLRWLPAPGGRIAAVLFVLTGIFYWKILFTRQAIFPWDLMDFHYPLLAFVHEELRHFRFPLWLPYAFSGFPVIADPEAQIFYPPNWLMTLSYFFAPLPLRLVEIQVIVHYFLAGLFMFYLARDFTRDTPSALFGAVLYQFSGAMVAHASHLAIIDANAWYPLIFMLARRGLLENRLYWTLLAGFFFGIENLTGHFQHAVLLGLLLFLYFAYEACFGPQRARLWPHWMTQLALIAAIGGGLAMVQILTTSQLSPLSIRAKVTAWQASQGNHSTYLWTAFLPNYLGGLNGVPYQHKLEPSFNYIFLTVPGCLFALLGLIQMARRRNFFWLGLIVVCCLISIGTAGHLAWALHYIPVLSLFRHAPMYFDLANFGLCLMAAVGVRAVWDETEHRAYSELLPKALIALVGLAVVLGWVFRLQNIPGWNRMVVVLAIFAGLIAGLKHGPFPPLLAQYGVIALVVVELFFHGMNQTFNQSLEDPHTAEAHEYVSGRRETLDFLRSDAGRDFRVAAIAEAQWSNGWSTWRIPGIYGWNPIMLRRYQEYIREFTHYSDYAQPHGGSDHLIASPMLDLLGVKYLVTVGSFGKELQLVESGEYQETFSDLDWWKVYRKKDYLSRAWFYPTASVLPEPGPLLALMNSRRFKEREWLLFAKSDLVDSEVRAAQELHTISLVPNHVTAPVGEAITDPDCHEPRRKFAYWVGKGNWVRFDFEGPKTKGRYLLFLQYNGAFPDPAVEVEVAQGTRRQVAGPIRLPQTWSWNCWTTRSAELGEFEVEPGAGQITLSLARDLAIEPYSLWLVRLPETLPQRARDFSFHNFEVSANRIRFQAKLSEDGYVLLNEIDYPGWRATIDGTPAEILRADSLFRALWVSAGTHDIEFRFWPQRLLPGAAISLGTLTAVAAALAVTRRSKTKPRRLGSTGSGLP